MRRMNTLTGILAVLLMNASLLSAEPVLRGFYIENLPAKATSKELAPDKSIVLAHILNCETTDLESGKYQIGVELDGNNGKKKTFIISPKDTIAAGTVKTFRLAVPKSDVDIKNGHFKVFTKINDAIKWSESFSYTPKTGNKSTNSVGMATLYSEAPNLHEVEPVNALPLPVVKADSDAPASSSTNDAVEKLRQKLAQIENAKISKEFNADIDVNNASKEVLNTVSTANEMAMAANNAVVNVKEEAKKAANNAENEAKKQVANAVAKPEEKIGRAVEKQNEKIQSQAQIAASNIEKIEEEAQKKAKKKAETVKADVVAEKPRDIDPNEFKKLKTIDEELIIYVIKEGDTLKSIAKKYYGNASKERVIADLNFIEKTSSIRVGEEIIVDVRPLSKSKQG